MLLTLESRYAISKQQISGAKYFLKFKDKQNCIRIYKAIIKNYK